MMDSDEESDDEMLDIEKKARRLDEDRCCNSLLTSHVSSPCFRSDRWVLYLGAPVVIAKDIPALC